MNWNYPTTIIVEDRLHHTFPKRETQLDLRVTQSVVHRVFNSTFNFHPSQRFPSLSMSRLPDQKSVWIWGTMSTAFPTPSVTRDRKQRNSPSRFRRPKGYSQSTRAIGVIRKGSEPRIDLKAEISFKPSEVSCHGSVTLRFWRSNVQSEARFEPKSILPTSKSTKTISQLRETSIALNPLQKVTHWILISVKMMNVYVLVGSSKSVLWVHR